MNLNNFVDLSNGGRYAGIVRCDDGDIVLASTVISAKWLKAVMADGLKEIPARRRDADAQIEITTFTTAKAPKDGYGFIGLRIFDKKTWDVSPPSNEGEKRIYAIAPVTNNSFERTKPTLSTPDESLRCEIDKLAKEVYRLKTAMKRDNKTPEPIAVLQMEQTVQSLYRTLAEG
jgi:hypothetical protein